MEVESDKANVEGGDVLWTGKIFFVCIVKKNNGNCCCCTAYQ